MNAFVVLSALFAVSQASYLPHHGPGYLVRAPKYDSASIESHRFGGNFAYSTAEAHAFAKATPQLATLTHPVAETTRTHYPAPIATHTPGKITKTTHVAKPIHKSVPILAQEPVVGTVGYKTLVHQPIVKKTIVSQPIVTAQHVSTPVVATGFVHAAPAVGAGFAHAAPAVGAGYVHAAPGAGYLHAAPAAGYVRAAPAVGAGYLHAAPVAAAPAHAY